MAEHHWITRADLAHAWFFVDDAGNGIRQITPHTYIGSPVRFTVTGPGYVATDHPSLEEPRPPPRA